MRVRAPLTFFFCEYTLKGMIALRQVLGTRIAGRWRCVAGDGYDTRMWRRLLDVIFWIGASLYFGGLVAGGAVGAPAVFQAVRRGNMSMSGIASPPLQADRQAGGEIFGAILNRFAYVEAACLVLMLVALAAWIVGQRVVRKSTWALLALWVLVAGLTAYEAGYLRPRVFTVRQEVRDQAAAHAADAPGAAWPARAEFESLHSRSETLGHAKAYALLGMIVLAAWRGTRRGAERHTSHDAMWKSRT